MHAALCGVDMKIHHLTTLPSILPSLLTCGVPKSATEAYLVEDGEEMDTNMFSSTAAGLRKKMSLPLPFTSIQSSGRNSLYPSMVSLKGR